MTQNISLPQSPLTIKDLNCGKCSKFSHIKKMIFTKKQCPGCGMNLEQEIELPACDGEPLQQFTPLSTKDTGCCLHPLALQVLAAPAIEELGKLRDIEYDDICGYSAKEAYKRAITLIKGDH